MVLPRYAPQMLGGLFVRRLRFRLVNHMNLIRVYLRSLVFICG